MGVVAKNRPTVLAANAEAPVLRRSARTRNALIAGARKVFSRTGFHEAKISEIAKEAGVAYGSFYTYFDSKEAVFYDVVIEVHREAFMITTARHEEDKDATPLQRIEATNKRYMKAYGDSARLLASFEHVAANNERFAALRAELRSAYIHRTEVGIKRWQREGIVDSALDASSIAHALGCMVERLTYMMAVFGEGPRSQARALAALNEVWARTLGLARMQNNSQ